MQHFSEKHPTLVERTKVITIKISLLTNMALCDAACLCGYEDAEDYAHYLITQGLGSHLHATAREVDESLTRSDEAAAVHADLVKKFGKPTGTTRRKKKRAR